MNKFLIIPILFFASCASNKKLTTNTYPYRKVFIETQGIDNFTRDKHEVNDIPGTVTITGKVVRYKKHNYTLVSMNPSNVVAMDYTQWIYVIK